jgi:hypothetical protein
MATDPVLKSFRFHNQEIDMSQGVDDIRAAIATIIIAQVDPKLPWEKALQIAAEQITPFLTCQARHGDRVNPAACMFCPMGHMTECHYPYSCEEAQCSHYQSAREAEE